MKERNIFWDNFKGILIFLVVFAHFLYAYRSLSSSFASHLVNFIYFFHMPAFVFTTGYFSRSENSNKPKAYLKLLVYYMIFNTILIIYGLLVSGSISVAVPRYSYWYLLSMIFWRLMIRPLSKIKFLLPISILVSLLIGFYPGINNTLSIVRTLAFFPFFVLGYKFDFKLFKEKVNKKKVLKAISIVVSLIIFAIVFYIACNASFSLNDILFFRYSNNFAFIKRVFLLLVAFLFIFILYLNIPKVKLPIITKAGKYSLLIYLIHRPITLLFKHYFPISDYSRYYIIYAFIASIVVLIIFSSDKINEYFNKFIDFLTSDNQKSIIFIIIMFIFILLLKPIYLVYNKICDSILENKEINTNNLEYKNVLDNTTSISYVGDLILLKDQVTSSFDQNTNSYNFDYMFANTKNYLSSSDYSIGVLEGPVANSKYGYSTSNYDDGIKLYQNYPEEFLSAIKDSGIDLVTTANNHMLDMGYEGVLDTIDALNRYNIDYVGTYKNELDKKTNSVKIIEINDIKIAILSYTMPSNYYSAKYFFQDNPSVSSIITSQNNKYYDNALRQVVDDFANAKAKNPNLILVMAHMGTQFIHTTNQMQDLWNDTFIKLGADIILSDHSHAVQPIEFKDNTLIVNCPGNFANSYTNYDGDATSIVEFYIDNDTKQVVGYSVIPMITLEISEGKYTAMPIYDYYDEGNKVHNARAIQILKLVTKVMLGTEIDLSHLQERYFVLDDQYLADNLESGKINEKLVNLITKAKSITFIGDSITNGTTNDYHPWYEPLMKEHYNKNVINISKGSLTSKQLIIEFKDEIIRSNSDLYIIAIGANDIRYRNPKICNMDANSYIDTINYLITLIKNSNQNAEIIFIAPWRSFGVDQLTILSRSEKNRLYYKYSEALKKYAQNNNFMYIDPNYYISNTLKYNLSINYLIDYIHPNDTLGINLYSRAVLYSN